MKNANFNKDKVTTMLGIILFIFAIIGYTCMLLAPYIVDVPKEFTDKHWYIPHVFLVAMLLLSFTAIISPDTIVRGVNKGIDKKFGDGKN